MKGVVLDILKKTPPPDKLDSEEDESESDEGTEASEASALEDFLSAVGIPAEKAEAAKGPLQDFVRACVRREMKSGY
jgi:hypothetical protein